MGVNLFVRVLDHSPADLTPAEQTILLAIAEDANDNDPRRLTWPGFDRQKLMRRTKLGDRGLQDALRRLAGRGLECRVPLGLDRKGNPLYAVPGKVVQYRLPEWSCRCRKCAEPAEKAPTTQGHVQTCPSPPEGYVQANPGHAVADPAHAVAYPYPSSPLPSKLASEAPPKPAPTTPTNHHRPTPRPTPRADKVHTLLLGAGVDPDGTAPCGRTNRASLGAYLAEHGKGLGVLVAAATDGTLPGMLSTWADWARPTPMPARITRDLRAVPNPMPASFRAAVTTYNTRSRAAGAYASSAATTRTEAQAQ